MDSNGIKDRMLNLEKQFNKIPENELNPFKNDKNGE
jgi:hypothetical protein